jgi:RNA polymerase sigma-70 factor (ECF subfamily)
MHSPDPIAAGDDLALLSHALEGDAESAKTLVTRLSPRAHALAWRMLGDRAAAEDVVQEAWVKLFRTRQFQGQARLSTYLHTVVARLCIDRVRSLEPVRYDSELADEVSGQESVPGPEWGVQQSEEVTQMQAAIQALPARQRLAISLWAYQDLGAVEIAEVLSIDRNAADQLLHRAKAGLKKRLEHAHEFA